jgi:hypothetical protein
MFSSWVTSLSVTSVRDAVWRMSPQFGPALRAVPQSRVGHCAVSVTVSL